MRKEERRGVDRKKLRRNLKIILAVLMLIAMVVGIGVFFWKVVYGTKKP